MSNPGRVLIVDDVPSILRIVSAMMNHLGWTVTTARGGREALAALKPDAFDLILLDISMPGVSGMEVCQNIRGNTAYWRVPIIAVTAHAQPEDRRIFLASGFDEVLIKPIDLARLGRAVTQVMQRVESV